MNKKGFTLIELLAVVVVLALILAIAVPAITGIITETKKKAMISDAKLIIKTLNLRKLESDTFDITGIDQTNIETDLSINDENYNVLVIKYKNEKPYITIEGKNKWDGLTVYGYFDDMQVIGSSEYDVVPPTLSIIGLSELTIEQGGTYLELGVLAEDNQDSNIQSKVVTTGSVDTSKLGTYTIKYNAEDLTGNTAVEKIRTIHVVAPADPVITFDPNTDTTYARMQSTTVAVTDNVAVNTASLKYLWSTNTTGIVEGDFTSSFTNNTEVTTPTNLTGNYYLWILAKDLAGNVTISRSDLFKLDNTEPTDVAAIIGDITSNSFKVTANGTDLDGGIKEYEFSIDDGMTWTAPQPSNIYEYTNLTTGTYGVRVRVTDSVEFKVESRTQNISTTSINTPSYSINESGWAQSKTVIIDYHTTLYTRQYSLDGGDTWNTVATQTKVLEFNTNGSVIAKITDGTNTVTASTYNITQIDTVSPTITFDTNGNTNYARTQSTTVTVTDNGLVDTTNLKYLWSNSATGIIEENITSSFTNGENITQTGVTGGYYLWILAKDMAGNTSILKSGVFNLDNTAPVITLNGSSSISVPQNWTYTDAGATANDLISGNCTVTTSGNVNAAVLGTYTLTYSAVDGSGNSAIQVTRTVQVFQSVYDYAFIGNFQTFTVPQTGKYKIELWGVGSNSGYGRGGYTKGEITLSINTSLYVYVGGQNNLFNGGGSKSNSGRLGNGATDIRTVSGTWNDTTGLRSRIMVAGSAGNGNGSLLGAPYGVATIQGNYGHGGGLTGYAGEVGYNASYASRIVYPGNPGTQTAGGSGGAAVGCGTSGGSGGFGTGGAAGLWCTVSSYTSIDGYGGSGGYYGSGGSGGDDAGYWSAIGTAGGSSFISGYTGCNAINSSGTHTGQPNHYSGYVFTNSQMIAGNASMPAPAGGTETGHSGNGYARITFIGQ